MVGKDFLRWLGNLKLVELIFGLNKLVEGVIPFFFMGGNVIWVVTLPSKSGHHFPVSQVTTSQ